MALLPKCNACNGLTTGQALCHECERLSHFERSMLTALNSIRIELRDIQGTVANHADWLEHAQRRSSRWPDC